MTSKPRLLLLTRPECGLCEEFRVELEQAFPGRFEIEEACVDDDAEWARRWGLKIPVLLDSSGALLCATRFDADSLT
ncbi:MAG TPA: glutaredoxin family protein [Verrucomicrobiae bacterium]|nr:glutaredoxin family protein [Verrucomicrobiae bacterium]